MTRQKLFASLWMRILVFLWMAIFPIVFVALPALEMLGDEAQMSWTPLWAFIVWVLGPLAVSIVLKYAGNDDKPSA